MRYLVLFLVVMLSVPLIAQQRQIDIPKYNDSTYTYWYIYKIELAKKLGLPIVQESEHDFHFRLGGNRQVIDIWKSDSGVLFGQITSWARESVPTDEEPTNRIWVVSKPLDSIQVEKIFLLIKESQIASIPDDMQIEGWKIIDDGVTYTIEISDSVSYVFKSYGNPQSQNVMEAKQVDGFVKEVFEVCKSKEVWSEFYISVPYQNFCYGGICTKMQGPRKLMRQYKKERNKYRKSIDS